MTKKPKTFKLTKFSYKIACPNCGATRIVETTFNEAIHIEKLTVVRCDSCHTIISYDLKVHLAPYMKALRQIAKETSKVF